MRVLSRLLSLTLIVAATLSISTQARAAGQPKDWTMLVFLNGHNNLDRFGAADINEMEQVGSTDSINVVVQWASMQNGPTRRVHVQKDNNPSRVTSPVIEEMDPVDMGDYRNVVEFVKWGAANYPAKKYFVVVWDHGGGWHINSDGISVRDISWDDLSGNFMTTPQLGQAMREASAAIGQKIDLYGSDACLMAMAEVGSEMKDSVNYFVGSEEVEPGEGWAYGDFLRGWAAKQDATPVDVARILTHTFVKSYQNGSQGDRDVTFSAFDLSQTDRLNDAIKSLGNRLMTLNQADRAKVVNATANTQSFTYSDYGDLIDFLDQLEKAKIDSVRADDLRAIRDVVGDYVIANEGTAEFANAHGVALWLPTSHATYSSYAARYRELDFDRVTSWGNVLEFVTKATR